MLRALSHGIKITASPPCGAAVTHQTVVRFHSQSQGMVERVNGTFKKLTTFLRNRVPEPKDEPPRRVEPGDQVYLRVRHLCLGGYDI